MSKQKHKVALRAQLEWEPNTRLPGRVLVDIKRRTKTKHALLPSVVELPNGTYTFILGNLYDVLNDLTYVPCKKRVRKKVNGRDNFVFQYKRLPIPTSPVPAQDAELFNLINNLRAQYGALPVTYNDRLEQAAQLHAEDMAKYDYLGHTSHDGTEFAKRVRASHYQGKPAGEVVSRGSIDPQDALNDWINSPEHFKALINPEFDNIGIGLCPKLYPGYTQAVNFWVVDFGYDMV